MNVEQAIQILTQALNGANLKGVYDLSASTSIVNALNVINKDSKKLEGLYQIGESYLTKDMYEFFQNMNSKTEKETLGSVNKNDTDK